VPALFAGTFILYELHAIGAKKYPFNKQPFVHLMSISSRQQLIVPSILPKEC
jgi:hypothetical protein